MKEKLSFNLTHTHSEFDSLVKFMDCIEEVEHQFGIEFASGVENGQFLFAKDYLFTDQEDEFLAKYDGLVIETCFRDVATKKIYDLNEVSCRLDISYDDEYRYNGNPQFSKPKIIAKSIKVSKAIKP